MPKVFFKTYGFQMNERDSEQVSRDLVARGYDLTANEKEADVVLKKRSALAEARREEFEAWASRVAGTIDTMGMDGKEYVDWLRGPRDDLDSD